EGGAMEEARGWRSGDQRAVSRRQGASRASGRLDPCRRRTHVRCSIPQGASMASNPLLAFSGLPRFDAIEPGHVGPAIAALLEEAQAAVAAAEAVADPTWDSFVLPLDEATQRLARAWGQVAHLEAVASTPPLRAAYNETLPAVTRFWSALGQNGALFAQYRRLATSPEFFGFSQARRKVVE